jgi:hypothetical protein
LAKGNDAVLDASVEGDAKPRPDEGSSLFLPHDLAGLFGGFS